MVVYFTQVRALRIAYPGKGRLMADASALLRQVDVPLSEGRAFFSEKKALFESVALRAKDIPRLVEQGFIDYGITGLDLVLETGADVVECARLPFGFCRLVLAAPPGTTVSDLSGKRIATAFPNLTSSFLSEKNIGAQVLTLSGAVEASVRLGMADAIVDLVESGTTLRQNGLVPVETVLSSCAVLIANKDAPVPGWLYA